MATEATSRELRRFAVLLFAVAAFASWRLLRRGVDVPIVAAIASVLVVMGIVGLVAPRALALPYRGWMALGHAMGLVTTPIVLTVVFFVVFTPVRGLLALFGIDPLARRWDRAAASYWTTRTRKKFRAEDFEHLT